MTTDVFSVVVLGTLRTQSQRLNLIAANVANLGTSGYRTQTAVTTEFVTARGGPSVSMSRLGAVVTDEAPGELRMTGGNLDLAISGEGYFIVEADNERMATRNGAFSVSSDGFLVDSSGRRVLGEGNAPIALPLGTTTIAVSADGLVRADGQDIAAIALVALPPQGQERRDGAAFLVGEDVAAVDDPRIVQGALEGSNVRPVTEIASMIEVTRAYERAQTLVEEDDRRVRNLIERLSRHT